MKSLSADTKVEGFRKGKAPADLVNKKLRQEKIYDELIRKLLPDIYEHIIKTEKLEPAISPKVELKKALEKEDWLIEFTVALKPHVTIPEYKKIVTEVKPLNKFFEAEESHQNYYDNNPLLPYCQVVISPKLAKIREKYAQLLK